MPYPASNCEPVRLIIRMVRTFGQALAVLRGERKGPAIAVVALGDNSTAKARRDFANYLSRIERDRVPGVGLNKLRLIAKGLGLEPLSSFFLQIELAQRNDTQGHSEFLNESLRSVADSDKNPPITLGGSHHVGGSLSHVSTVADLSQSVIRDIAHLLLSSTENVRRQAPNATAHRRGRGTTHRKASR